MADFKNALHWFRRDFRLRDNQALYAAISRAEQVIPVYIVSEWTKGHPWTGAARQQFLCECLDSLDKNIAHIGGKLIFRRGNAIEQLLQLAKEAKADAIFCNRDPDPFGAATEKELERRCGELGIKFICQQDAVFHGADEILTQSQDKPYRVFTPYSKVWRKLPKTSPAPAVTRLAAFDNLSSDPPPTLDTWQLTRPAGNYLKGGEKAAQQRLQDALGNVIGSYHETRNTPAGKTTSRLSQDLRFGTLSIRQIYSKLLTLAENDSSSVRQGAWTYLGELAWREFYMAILAHFPEVLELEFNPDWRGLPWAEPGEQFEAWKAGMTGFPIVDAAMRELNQTGFMHNRPRMITAMFLTKDLHLDWRLGEQYFMQKLIDGEIASNNGGWQWSAGTGADAAPYFRIQNPWTQSSRFDPNGEYIKQWIPELKDTPAKALHSHPADNATLAKGYPKPIVDHSEERKLTLQIFKDHKAARS